MDAPAIQPPAGYEGWQEHHKGDRERMAAAIADLARHHGAAVSRELRGLPSPREVQVHISLNGVGLMLDFDGCSSQPDVFVCAWHVETGWHRRLSYAFGRAAGGEVNRFHAAKCTAVAHGFDDLWHAVDEALAVIASYEAFQPGFEVLASPRIAAALYMSRADALSGGQDNGGKYARRAIRWQRNGANVRLAFFPTMGEARAFMATLAEAVAQRYAAKGRRRYHGGEIFASSLALQYLPRPSLRKAA